MTKSSFRKPAPVAATFKATDHVGDLIMVLPTAYITATTKFGERECVEATVVVLDDAGGPPAEEPEPIKDARIFGKVLSNQLADSEGQWTLGRLELGVAKGGQNAPYRLADPTAQDEKVAEEWLANHPEVND
jgi:hypothetical protein